MDKRFFLLLLIVTIFVVGTYFVFQVTRTPWIEMFELKSVDMRFNIRGERIPSPNVVIVGIDERTLMKIESEYSDAWPWSRKRYALLIERLANAGAKAIVFDISLTNASNEDPQGDLYFIQMLKKYPLVILPGYLANSSTYSLYPLKEKKALASNLRYTEFAYKIAGSPFAIDKSSLYGTYKIIPPLKMFSDSTWGTTFYEIGPPDVDGIFRSVPLVLYERYADEKGLPCFFPPLAVMGTIKYLGLKQGDYYLNLDRNEVVLGNIHIPVDSDGYFTVNYYGAYGTIKNFSAIDVMENYSEDKLKTIFKDKMAFIGYTPTSKGLYDLRPTPFYQNGPGIDIHATIASNILQRDFLTRFPYSSLLYLSLVIAFFFSMLSIRNIYKMAVLGGTWIVVYLLVCQYAFAQNVWIDLFYPTLSFVLMYLTTLIYKGLREYREKKTTKMYFSKYVPSEVVDKILADPSAIKLGGERKKITVLFSDIVGFTTISESLDPVQLVELLNSYLGRMTDIIKNEYHGMVDKYEGDAIIAIFGAPFSYEDDAKRAVFTAIRMQEELDKIKEEWAEQGKEYPIRIGIGINTGYAVVGNVGSEDRMNYTCIGDAVNVAARLETLTRKVKKYILITDSTYEEVKDYVDAVEIDPVMLKGKTRPTRIYSVSGEKKGI
ncbi:MAG: adenylate/guanylate cyclase domain-containing protein [Thermotogae bacterium]|nr:adenylate/guanylate cyclase domain-containing protein [Thermotogota bacterium]